MMAEKPPEPAREAAPAIPDTPENIARAIMVGAPKEEWRYLDDELKGHDDEPESDGL